MTPAGVQATSASRPCISRPALVGRQPVHVLGRVDQRRQLGVVQVVGQRQLEQDAVDARVGVQLGDQRRQVLARHVATRLVVEGLDAHLGAVLALHAHVDGRGRVVAHQHGGQARASGPRTRWPPYALAHGRRDGLAVDDRGAHCFFFEGAKSAISLRSE